MAVENNLQVCLLFLELGHVNLPVVSVLGFVLSYQNHDQDLKKKKKTKHTVVPFSGDVRALPLGSHILPRVQQDLTCQAREPKLISGEVLAVRFVIKR